MTTITIPKKLTKDGDLIIIPRKKYKELLELEKKLERLVAEERDTDLAVSIYQDEKRRGRLKSIKSLADLR